MRRALTLPEPELRTCDDPASEGEASEEAPYHFTAYLQGSSTPVLRTTSEHELTGLLRLHRVRDPERLTEQLKQ